LDYLSTLNTAQRQAAEHIEGPLMVIAGAGSGKTRVLTYRIAHLIHNGVDPFKILALTFTNKAAKEMKERISTIVGPEAKNIWMGTFHSVFSRILRTEAEKINFPKNFTIYDTQDSRNLIKAIIKQMGCDDKIYKPNICHGRISAAKNNLISPKRYMEDVTIQADDREAGRPRLGEIYTEYWQRCYKAGAMDFDDLLFRTNILLRDFPDVLYKYQNLFQYLLVDEYQDTNHAQYLIVKKLAAMHHNVCVVGDDAQSIYAFRGANIQNILNFRKDYPDYKLYKLEQNYRSTKVIVNAANSVIKNNEGQIEKNVWTDNLEGDKIKITQSASDNDEAKLVANSIFDTAIGHQEDYKDFAILYRTNAQSRSMEEALRRLNIPYKIFGGLSFYQRKEIKDLLSYFRLTANPQDEEALKRIINYPKRGIGNTTMEKVVIQANEHQCSLWDVMDDPKDKGLDLSVAVLNKLEEFCTTIKAFRAQMESKTAFDLAQEIATKSGMLRELYADKTPEGVSRHDNIQELLNGIQDFTERSKNEDPDAPAILSDFLMDVALLTDLDQEDDDPNRVSLMTIHSAKGLEYPNVYVVGMEENLFPSQMSISSRSDLEEERRLFYVAITRAEKRAHLSYAESRFKWGQLTYCEPSRFLEEIDENFVDRPLDVGARSRNNNFAAKVVASSKYSDRKAPPKRTAPENKKPVAIPPSGKQKSLKDAMNSAGTQNSNDYSNLVVGSAVTHAKFGKGKVLQLEGDAPNTMATIYFPSAGQKKLILKFAKLTILD
jgi:DNA helicase-2/ATP-dependent DNA helicase PcrA